MFISEAYTHQAGYKTSFVVSPQSRSVEGLHVFDDTSYRDAPVESHVSFVSEILSSPSQLVVGALQHIVTT